MINFKAMIKDPNLVKYAEGNGDKNIKLVHNTDKLRFEIIDNGNLINFFEKLPDCAKHYDAFIDTRGYEVIFSREVEYYEN